MAEGLVLKTSGAREGVSIAPPRGLRDSYELRHRLRVHGERGDDRLCVWAALFLPGLDGAESSVVATAGGEQITFLDCASGRVLKRYHYPNEEFCALAWTVFNGNVVVAAGGQGGDVTLIHYDQNVCHASLESPRGGAVALEFHPTLTNILAVGYSGGAVEMWDVGAPEGVGLTAAAQRLTRLNCKAAVVSVAFSSDGALVVVGTVAGVEVWKPQALDGSVEIHKKPLYVFDSLHVGVVDCVALVENDMFASKGAQEGVITVWTADDVTPIDREISVPFRDDLYFLKFAPEPGNRFTVLCPTPTGEIHVIDLETSETLRVLRDPAERPATIHDVAVSHQSTWVVGVNAANTVLVWEAAA